MFQTLVSHNADLRRLVDKGYAVAFDTNCLVVRDIPYLDADGALQTGAMVAKLVFIDHEHVRQDDHQVYFAGSVPHGLDGKPIPNLAGGTCQLTLSDACKDVVVRPLLESHVVSYIPSGSILAVLRSRRPDEGTRRAALAVAASPPGQVPQAAPSGNGPSATRGIYDLDTAELPELPFAEDEARAVAATFGAGSTVLAGDAGTELEFKRQPLNEYEVLHFAVHGVVSTKFPARSALVLRAADGEDGLLQAREILTMRLSAGLVTLSACETGTGAVHGQEGVASLVRPFIAAGAQAVVANLWTADDRFSLTLMREFYRQLATRTDIAQALRNAKLKMLEQFGPTAAEKLWSGVLVYGDAAGAVGERASRTQSAGVR